MPTYEYECMHCGHRFEAFQQMTAEPLKECPKCNKKVKRLISSGSGIIFKGSGFYATDYRKKSIGKDKEAPKAAPSTSTCPGAGEACHTCKHK